MNKCVKYALFLVAVCVFVAAALGVYRHADRIDADKILAHSVLKDKTFASKVQEIEADGMKAYLLEEHSNPIIAVSFMFANAGSAYEAEDKQGLTTLLSAMLLNGAGDYDALQFKDISEEYGVRIGFENGVDDFGGFMETPTAAKDMAIKLLTSTLYKPYFTYDYIALTKNQMQTALRNHKEKPNGILADKYAEIIFAGHPYARPAIGTAETIESLTRGDLMRFMHEHLTKQNIIIGIAGDINAADAEQLIRDLFGALPDDFAVARIDEFVPETSGAEHDIAHNSPQAITHFVTKGTHRNSDDFYPLYLANYIFGGSGLNSRISKVVREKEGLTYGIYTYLTSKETAALLSGGYSSTPENFNKAKDILLQEWQKLGAAGVTAQELQQAKDSMIAAHNLRFASIGGIAEMLVAMQQYQLGIDFLEKRNDYVRAVTLEQVNAAAKEYFGGLPDFVTIGNLSSDKEEN
ncbi:MAG: insulinase family protein [Alphaproteobacteria bacterium]|nr:insulinase family protein [Alphaproteobacteria bacterium]